MKKGWKSSKNVKKGSTYVRPFKKSKKGRKTLKNNLKKGSILREIWPFFRGSIFDTKNTTSWRDLANKEFFGQIGPKISPFDPYTPKYVDIRQLLVFDQEWFWPFLTFFDDFWTFRPFFDLFKGLRHVDPFLTFFDLFSSFI